MSDLMKGIFKGVRKEILNFADTALKNGTANVGKQLARATRDINPSDLELRTVAYALKRGIKATGQDLLVMGLDRVKEFSSQDQKSQVT